MLAAREAPHGRAPRVIGRHVPRDLFRRRLGALARPKVGATAGGVVMIAASIWALSSQGAALSSQGATTSATAGTLTRTFSARADARVEEANPGTNYGAAPTLVARGGTAPDIQSFLRFRVHDITGPIRSATLWLRTAKGPDAGTADGPAIYRTSPTAWSETGITWANRPGHASTAADDKGAIPADRWIGYDVKSVVSGNGAYAFALAGTSADGAAFHSREVAGRKPRLVVELADTQPPSPPSALRGRAVDSTAVRLSWTASTDNVRVAGYRIFRNDVPLATIGPNTQYLDRTVLPGGQYRYTVRAFDAARNVSNPSNTVRVTTPITLSYAPEADARVQEDKPSLNYGTLPKLRVRGGSGIDIESFLRFRPTGISGTVLSATLWLRTGGSPEDGTVNGPVLYRTDNTWSETGITWANRPGRTSRALADKGAIPADSWVGYDVTAAVPGNATKSFTLASSSGDEVAFNSRETSDRPRLVVRFIPEEQLVMAAGDIACDPSSSDFNGGLGTTTACHQMRTSDLLVDRGIAAALPLGDLQYSDATLSEFSGSYDPSWGRVKNRTHPTPGNHEYRTSGAAGYFDYFNGPGVVHGRAGERGKGYYSYDLGAWHLIALNSECSDVGGCEASSPQGQWLKQDLERNKRACTLAYWHRPRFSSGRHGNQESMGPFWQLLYEAGADVVLSGHDHSYERFAPQTPAGALAPGRGIRQFVVGTGGKDHYSFGTPEPNSQIRDSSSFGVLALTLRPGRYLWQFLPAAGSTFVDSGVGSCHDAPAQ
jgi:hypothetical protein